LGNDELNKEKDTHGVPLPPLKDENHLEPPECELPIKLDGIKLEYRDVAGAGKQIHAYLGRKFMCVEFTLRDDKPQMIASEPWIQFEPPEWTKTIGAVFQELVDLFNIQHNEGPCDYCMDKTFRMSDRYCNICGRKLPRPE